MAKKKRKLNPTLKAWNVCWREIGVSPLTDKVTAADKAKARACVDKKLGRKASAKKA